MFVQWLYFKILSNCFWMNWPFGELLTPQKIGEKNKTIPLLGVCRHSQKLIIEKQLELSHSKIRKYADHPRPIRPMGRDYFIFYERWTHFHVFLIRNFTIFRENTVSGHLWLSIKMKCRQAMFAYRHALSCLKFLIFVFRQEYDKNVFEKKWLHPLPPERTTPELH